ncbi:MAG: hypothetical protein GY842_00345, partial [bacterium]|nr:hypothetical protein [bacterium]
VAGLAAVIGPDVPIVGGSAIGVITHEALSYTGHPACAAVFEAEQIGFKIAFSDNLDQDPRDAGERLLARLAPADHEKLLLVFYDSIKRPATAAGPPVMNPSGPLIEGLSRNLNPGCVTLGAGLMGGLDFGPTRQFCFDRTLSQSAVGLMLSGQFHPYFTVFHGCTPLDGIYHTITRMQGDQIYEIDHEPAVELIDSAFGTTGWRQQNPVNLVTLGVNCGERFEAPQESNYINRLITGVLPDNAGIGIFEPDLTEGTEIQFMLRDPERMVESA